MSSARARRTPPRPTGTSRPGCRRAAAGRGWSRRRAGSPWPCTVTGSAKVNVRSRYDGRTSAGPGQLHRRDRGARCGRSRPTGAPDGGCSSTRSPSRSPADAAVPGPVVAGARRRAGGGVGLRPRRRTRATAVGGGAHRFIDDAVTAARGDGRPARDPRRRLRHARAPSARGEARSRPSRSTTRPRRPARSRSSRVKASTPAG